MLGAWVDTPLVGEFGKVQGSGWMHNARVLVGTAASDTGLGCVATTSECYLTPTADPAGIDYHGALCVLTEIATNMTDATEGQHSVFWRCF
jgi:hypothetical protein